MRLPRSGGQRATGSAHWVRAAWVVLLLVAAALSACATPPEPDLVQIHATTAAREKPPLIVIPGLMGSRLVDRTAGKEIWPGSLFSLVIGRADRFDRLALPPGRGDDTLEPRGLFAEALGEDYYHRLVESLTTAGGYDCVAADRATASLLRLDEDVADAERVEDGALGRGAWTFAELEATFARSLRRAEAFHRALSVPLEDSPLRYVVFGGDCIMTPALCLLEVVNGEPKVRLHPDEVVNRLPGIDYERLMLEPGDGKVTRSSLLARDRLQPQVAASLPIGQLIFVCEPHAELSSNLTFRDNLLNQLLYPWT